MTWSPAPPTKNYICICNVPMVGSGIQTNVGPVEVATSDTDKKKKKDTKEIKIKCSCRVICSRPDEDSPWKVTKANLEHTGHTVPSKRAQAREKRVLKEEWVTMIKDHGRLGLPPSTSYELLEKHFGEEFSNALIEPRDISNLQPKQPPTHDGPTAPSRCETA